ncbi:amino acid adenylation domain-containing protein [Longispora sp. NPDC051575]|uniref:non-ribosomal peptide synthetase/MFS transporter n=1 Tax=Longispora sp. NPDC051575 TaxID=3154943 RepID=UPI00342F0309
MTAVDSVADPKRAAMEARLRRRVAPTESGIPRRPDGEAPPLSYAQERVWFMEQFAPGTAAYGSPLLVRLGADLDLELLAAALTQVRARHESLRMRFPATEDGRPTVVVDPPSDVELPVHDAADVATAEAEMALAALRPFDLATGPLMRAAVWRVAGGERHLLLVDLHHIVTDGWSNDTLLADLSGTYEGLRSGVPTTRRTPVGYGDFAAWQREQMAGPGVRRHLDYWLEQLAAVPALELPTDAPRPPTQSFDGASHHFRLEGPLVTALTALGQAHRATLFMALLAGYQTLLGRYSGQHDFAIGSPVAGRSRPDLDDVVGMFVNMLPLRADLSGDPTVGALLDRTRDGVLDALAHQDVPFEQVINELHLVRDVSRSALFQAMLVLQNYTAPTDPDSPDLSWRPVELPATRFDLELHAYPVEGGGLQCRFVYNTALFGADTVARLAGSFGTLLADLVARPDAPVSELELLDAAERDLLRAWNATEVPARPDSSLPALFAEQARRAPDAVAVTDAGGSLTYAELDRASNRVAHRLLALGAGPETLVGIGADRGARLVVGLLGILKTGAAYLPLDPEYPDDRLRYMLADSGCALLLATDALAARVAGDGVTHLRLDEETDGHEHAVDVLVPTDAAAYLIYTSGSTGRPKGVVNAHRGVLNRLDWMQSTFGLGADDTVLQKTPAGFDVSVWEFFWPLTTGARLAMAAPGGHRDPAYLREAVGEHGVTTVHFVPSMLTAFLADIDAAEDPAAAAARCATLRRIVCSGEELPVELARRCVEVLPWVSLHNLYGPTEAAIDVTAWHCAPGALAVRTRVPIGAPIANTRVHILDEHLREVPVGAVGQLHIGGVQVARGYHRRPALTAERFVPDPFGASGTRLYATGDLARWRPDGQVEFLGRADGQVKLRGLRIELGEIEMVLRERADTRDVTVAVVEVHPGDKRIVAYLVTDAEPDAAALRADLLLRLPDYMVPSAFVRLPELPLSPNGKLDRARLPLPEVATVSDKEFVAPRTDTEITVAGIWCDVLGVERVGIDDDFFALGGHSLLLTQVAARLRPLTQGTDVRVGVMDLFQNPTVRALAALLSGEADSGPRRLLYELTRPNPRPERTYVCVPYGGGSAVVYQTVASALPAGHALLSVAIPGHDVGLDEDSLPFDELARRCADEVLERVHGPLVLYGHCGVGGALIVEMARLVEAAGREVEAVYVGGVFPFAKPTGLLTRFNTWLEDLAGNRNYTNWLKSMGVDMDELDPVQADRIISNMRSDGKNAEAHFTALMATDPVKLKAPIISVVGERDPITDYYQERYREWRFLTDTVAVVVLDEAGHFFLRYRAEDVVEIITRTHLDLPAESAQLTPPDTEPGTPARRWWLSAVSRAGQASDLGAPVEPTMSKFTMVSLGQLVSVTGSLLTAWAIPIWLYVTTGSLLSIGISGVTVVLPILLATPIAGALADRYDRRKLMMAAGLAAGSVEFLFAVLLLRGNPPVAAVYAVVLVVSFAGTFQRIAFAASIPQLVPKRFLGHANGVAQLINGTAMLFVPLMAAGLLAAIGLRGILVLDVVSYVFALSVLAAVRFPNLMGRIRKETFGEQVLGGLRLYWGAPGFRASILVHGFSNLLYAAPVLLVPPLVLAHGTAGDVGRAAFAEGLGAVIGSLAMTIWGGPRARRMVGNLLVTAASGLFVALTGLSGNLLVIMVGAFGTGLFLAIANGIYVTVIQVKMPQRYHGRVLALNQTLTWSTLPVGFLVLVPATGLLEPLMAPGGSLASTFGQVLGTGPGRGIGLAFVVFGLLMTVNALLGLTVRRLARLDIEMPDSLPDDLIGAQLLAARDTAAPAPREKALV